MAKKRRTRKELARALVSEFTIDDYLELRRRYPSQDSPLWMVLGSDRSTPSFGLDYAFQLESDLARFGIEINTFLGALDGDDHLVDLLCLRVLEAMSAREKTEGQNPHAVASGLAIGDSLIDFLCIAVVEAVSYYDLRLPNSLQILLKARLRLFDSAILRDRRIKHRRVLVSLFIAKHPEMSIRQVAKATGVNAGTISRWMVDPDFGRYVEIFRDSPRMS